MDLTRIITSQEDIALAIQLMRKYKEKQVFLSLDGAIPFTDLIEANPSLNIGEDNESKFAAVTIYYSTGDRDAILQEIRDDFGGIITRAGYDFLPRMERR